MGRFVYSMNVSVDLRIEQVPGDDGAGEWLSIDEELHREFNAQARALIRALLHGIYRPRRSDQKASFSR